MNLSNVKLFQNPWQTASGVSTSTLVFMCAATEEYLAIFVMNSLYIHMYVYIYMNFYKVDNRQP